MIRCQDCHERMKFLGVEKILEDKIKVRTYGCLTCGSCEFIPTPKKDFLYWCKGVNGRLKKIHVKTK